MLKERWFKCCNIALMPLLLLTGCAGLGDYDIDLPGDYSIVRTTAHNVTIAPKEGECS